MTHEVVTQRIEETMSLGSSIARKLRPGDIITLSGPLGSGKTSFVRGFVAGLDPEKAELVTSQSYVVAVTYPTRPPIAHLDLYRLSHPEEVIGLGYEELLFAENIALIEWPELLEPFIEADDPVLGLHFLRGAERDRRRITAESKSRRLLNAFIESNL